MQSMTTQHDLYPQSRHLVPIIHDTATLQSTSHNHRVHLEDLDMNADFELEFYPHVEKDMHVVRKQREERSHTTSEEVEENSNQKKKHNILRRMRSNPNSYSQKKQSQLGRGKQVDSKENQENGLAGNYSSPKQHTRKHSNSGKALKIKAEKNNKKTKSSDSIDSAYQPDPLTSLIESYNTQKVRFDLGQNKVIDKSIPKSSSDLKGSTANIKKLTKRVLFRKSSQDDADDNDDIENDQFLYSKDIPVLQKSSSITKRMEKGRVNTSAKPRDKFVENRVTSSLIQSRIDKGEVAQNTIFQYSTATKHYIQSMSLLDKHSYPADHKLRIKTLKNLNDVQHSRRSLEHSCQIVKMGLKHEEKEEYMKALKMYTIAYRMRRDTLGEKHPSLPVLLNMLGSIQAKRGDLNEAMQIFQLSLYGRLTNSDNGEIECLSSANPWTKSSTLREMGIIHEKRGEPEKALKMYHESLSCVLRVTMDESSKEQNVSLGSIDEVRLVRTHGSFAQTEEMEAYLDGQTHNSIEELNVEIDPCGFYNSIFNEDRPMQSKNVNIHIAMTLYYVGNILRKSNDLQAALCAYEAAYRGMKKFLGNDHTNVAAILGNIGNVYKEIMDYDEAHKIYQEVLRIESHHFGLGHPEVIVTMHNIAMIEQCRGNYAEAISLYREVLNLQRSRLGPKHDSLSVTALCLAEVYEICEEYSSAIAIYKKTIQLRSEALTKSHPEVGSLHHSCALVYVKNKDFINANAHLKRAIRLFEFNNIVDHRMIDAKKDRADVQASLALLPTT